MATFADMAIILMAFFALLYSFSSINVTERAHFAATIRMAFGVQRTVIVDDISTATSMLNESFTPIIAEVSPLAEPTKEAPTPVRTYRAKYSETEAGTTAVEQAKINLKRTLSEEIVRGEVKVKVEDDIVVIELRSLFSAGGAGDEDDERKGARVKQSVIDIAAKVLTINSDSKVQVDFRTQDLKVPKADDAENILDLDRHYAQMQDVLAEEISKGKLEVMLKDDLLVVRLNSQDSFDSGQARLTPAAKSFLDKLGKILYTLSGRIRIEGHTDDMPVMFSERFVSNWDLSAARASSVAAVFITGSEIPQTRLVIAGFADSKPLVSNGTKEGRAKNRRIEIIVSTGASEDLKPNG
jgi:chemotaxis protein MotB